MPSQHFSLTALECPCCKQNFCFQRTYDMLEEFRELVGKPVVVLSGYRCRDHNKTVGGALRSQHQFGTAADIRVDGMTAAEMEAIAHQCHLIVGIGRNDYTGFLHIDCRSADPVKWCYDDKGQQCQYYPPKVDVSGPKVA